MLLHLRWVLEDDITRVLLHYEPLPRRSGSGLADPRLRCTREVSLVFVIGEACRLSIFDLICADRCLRFLMARTILTQWSTSQVARSRRWALWQFTSLPFCSDCRFRRWSVPTGIGDDLGTGAYRRTWRADGISLWFGAGGSPDFGLCRVRGGMAFRDRPSLVSAPGQLFQNRLRLRPVDDESP